MHPGSMFKGPLVYAAALLAGVLIVMSFLIVAFPDSIEVLGIIAGVAAIAVVAVLFAILVKTRRGAL